jgi:hypothetical protein
MEKQQPVQPKWYGAIFIAIARMMKGLVINFELSVPAANVMLLWQR